MPVALIGRWKIVLGDVEMNTGDDWHKYQAPPLKQT